MSVRVNQIPGGQTPYVEALPAVSGGFAAVEFADNPEPRVPCLLLLDTSTSMNGAPILELNGGLRDFKNELLLDPLATKRVEVAIVTFGHTASLVQDFIGVDGFDPPRLHADGATAMGAAIREGLRCLESRKQRYRDNGIAYYRPWVFLITDGAPTDDVSAAARAIRDGERNRAFSFYGVGAGPQADFARLNEICPPERPAVRLGGLRFSELFTWLSRSMSGVSRSTPGGTIALPPATGWMQATT